MDNVHRDYLLKQFYEERNGIIALLGGSSGEVRMFVEERLAEIEFQINRAFVDMEKERARRLGIEVKP